MAPPLIRDALHGWIPDIVIGIDFGMTCTGVAWTKIKNKPEQDEAQKKKDRRKSKVGEQLAAAQISEPAMLQHWGSLRDNQLVGKVPTEITYDATGEQPTTWGLFSRNQQDRTGVKRLFKLNMSTQATTTADYGHELEDSRRYYKDYMTRLCDHIERYMARFDGYESLRVEYVFSVPTSWKFDTEMLQFVYRTMREIVGQTQTRRVVIGLSEAAAAAVSVGRKRLSKDDVILVCDIGGGTSDVNIVKVISAEESSINMEALTYDEGQLVGSTCIDQAARKYVIQQFGEKVDAHDIALIDQAILGPFQRIKHDYGTAESESRTQHMLYIDETRGSIKIPDKVMRQWFDEEIFKIKSLVQSQMEKLKTEHKKEKISMMVLSGGFGQNQYVQDQLKAQLRDAVAAKNKSISSDVKVDHIAEPYFAVARGLVYARVQELITGMSVFDKVCSRQSYGVVVKEEYSKRKHSAQKGDVPVKSPSDGKLYMFGQIDWIIEEGVMVESTQVKKSYKWVIPRDDSNVDDWCCEIVTCTSPRDNLPRNKDHRSVEPVCKIILDMDKLTVEKEKTGMSGWKLKKEFVRVVEFDLVVHIGAADVKFSIHPIGECDTLASMEHDEIEVDWRATKDWGNVAVMELRQPMAKR